MGGITVDADTSDVVGGEEIWLANSNKPRKSLYGTNSREEIEPENIVVSAVSALRCQSDEGGRQLRKDIVQMYNDVLRVGKMRLNQKIIAWSTDATTEKQLGSFHTAFLSALENLPEVAGLDPLLLHDVPYWFAKAVALTYVPIADVMQRVGATKIETRAGESARLEYNVSLNSSHEMRVDLSWSGKDNMICTDPNTGAVQVRGTMIGLQMTFQLPLTSDSVPVYRFRLQRAPVAAVEYDFTIVLDKSKGEKVGAVIVGEGG